MVIKMPWKAAIALLVVLLSLVGCSQFGYYLQSAGGQLDILARREPLAELVADANTDPQLRERLRRIAAMRTFASDSLGLPDNDSYRSYADLQRDYVVWNVFAAAEFSVQPRTWCFPFVGCLSYRGYFREARAERYAQRLRAAGDDVYVAGIVAYSTLGHFADPVLNTMLKGDDLYVAGVLFHELAHQVMYIRDATDFNEAFASLVEEEGVRRWLEHTGDTAGWQTWQQRQLRRDEFSGLVVATRDRLEQLYAGGYGEHELRRRKGEILQAMRDAHEQIRRRTGTDTGYEAWFAGPLNNAQLASVVTYRRLVPAFRQLLTDCNNDLPRFYTRVIQISELPEQQRVATMERLLSRSGLASPAAVFIEAAAPRLVAQ